MNEPVRVTPIFGDDHQEMPSKNVIFWTPDRMDPGLPDPRDTARASARGGWWARILRIVPGTAA